MVLLHPSAQSAGGRTEIPEAENGHGQAEAKFISGHPSFLALSDVAGWKEKSAGTGTEVSILVTPRGSAGLAETHSSRGR